MRRREGDSSFSLLRSLDTFRTADPSSLWPHVRASDTLLGLN
jgi:hypothetical protein